MLLPKDIVLLPPAPPWLIPPINKNQNIKNIINIPNGVNSCKIIINIDWSSSVTVIVPAFILSSNDVIKLSTLGIFTSFGTLSFVNSTIAVVPSYDNSTSFTSPDSILLINSEYASLLSVLLKIEEINTISIIPIISHIANVFIPFFKTKLLLFNS